MAGDGLDYESPALTAELQPLILLKHCLSVPFVFLKLC
jgi:hypothetical protein